MKNKWTRLSRMLILFFSLILFLNALSLFTEIKRDITYNNRAYGLSTLDDYFDNGEYYQIYVCTVKNKLADEKPAVDTSQYEAFGRLFEAYLNARSHEDNAEYIKQIQEEKKNISWNKILTVVESLENDLNNN